MANGSGVQERMVVSAFVPYTVARAVFALSAALSAIVVVGFVALYLLAAVSGALEAVDAVMRSLGLQLGFFGLLVLLTLLGGLASVGSAAVAALAAVLYNLLSDVVGGVEVVGHTRERSGMVGEPHRQVPAEASGRRTG